MATPIGTLGAVPTLTVGNRVFTDLTNLIVLEASVDGPTAGNNYATFRKTWGSAGYAVTSAKTLKVYAMRVQGDALAGADGALIGYGDTDVGLRSASAPTNPVYMNSGGTTTGAGNGFTPRTGSTAPVETAFDGASGAPAAKYMFASGNGAAKLHIQLFCYEV